jgi:DNA modification methylase
MDGGEAITGGVTLFAGDCLSVLRGMPDASVEAVVTDPPYPCIKRSYGYWTEAEWFDLMNPVVEECRRILKPTGSAVFVLQPNSERVGRMRTWLWEFMAKWGREWGVVQDAYWWNHAMPPVGGANVAGLMRGSVKPCVWLGASGCYRDQESVLWTESERNAARRQADRFAGVERRPSGRTFTVAAFDAAARRGGVTPFNVLPIPNTNSTDSAGAHGHGAGTPLALCRWWVRYICPPGGTVLEPFAGSGTVGIAAVQEGRKAILIEKEPAYCDIIRRRLPAPVRSA